jgi:CRISPR/Cas system-associated endoribonuclease Cas2
MSKRQHASKRSAHEIAKSAQNTPKITKDTQQLTPKSKEEEMDRIDELCSMMQTVIKKLETLDLIKDRILSVEQDVKSLKESINFAHAELNDLKKEMKERKEAEDEREIKIKILEDSNRWLQESVIDLKARSMRDNLLFHNIQESDKEDCTDIIFKLLEEKLEMPDARREIKIDQAHRVGRKHDDRRKPRAIVAKFNFFPDREKIRYNAKKLKGTQIRISEQFPEEIEKVQQTLYPEMRRAKAANQRVLVRDKLFINNVEFIP